MVGLLQSCFPCSLGSTALPGSASIGGRLATVWRQQAGGVQAGWSAREHSPPAYNSTSSPARRPTGRFPYPSSSFCVQPPLSDAESVRDAVIAKLFEDLGRQGLDAHHPFGAYGGEGEAAAGKGGGEGTPAAAGPSHQPSRLRSLLSLGKQKSGKVRLAVCGCEGGVWELAVGWQTHCCLWASRSRASEAWHRVGGGVGLWQQCCVGAAACPPSRSSLFLLHPSTGHHAPWW